MRTKNLVVATLILTGLALLGWPKTEVPVPDHLGTSRDWTAPDNAALFQTVETDEKDEKTYDKVIFDELAEADTANR